MKLVLMGLVVLSFLSIEARTPPAVEVGYNPIAIAGVVNGVKASQSCKGIEDTAAVTEVGDFGGSGEVSTSGACQKEKYKMAGTYKVSGNSIVPKDNTSDCTSYVTGVLATAGCNVKEGVSAKQMLEQGGRLESTGLQNDAKSGKNKCLIALDDSATPAPGDIVVYGDSGGGSGHAAILTHVDETRGGSLREKLQGAKISHQNKTGGTVTQDNISPKFLAGNTTVIRYNYGEPGCECKKENAMPHNNRITCGPIRSCQSQIASIESQMKDALENPSKILEGAVQ